MRNNSVPFNVYKNVCIVIETHTDYIEPTSKYIVVIIFLVLVYVENILKMYGVENTPILSEYYRRLAGRS